MHLVDHEAIDALRTELATEGDPSELRTATVTIDHDPFDFARTGAALVDRAVAFAGPDGVRIAGLGTAWRASSTGSTRFSDLREASRRIPDGAKAFVGFSFRPDMRDDAGSTLWDGFASAEIFVPRISIEGSEGGSEIRVVVPAGEPVDPTLDLLASMQQPAWTDVVDIGGHATESVPPIGDWAKQVDHALDQITAGEFKKAVLARSVIVRSETPPAILRMFRSLVQSYPLCYNFAWKSGDAVFMGASPELLASVAGDRLVSNPLAGSAPRGEGSDDDDAIGFELLRSDKDRREHKLVVDDVVDRLANVAGGLTMTDEPELKKMASVQHLSTRIEGTVQAGLGILDAVEAIHPTPAVGGSPRDASLRAIDATETIERGWYTGGVGWVDNQGNGTVALALRCGLIRGMTTHLFAGAGIVAGSSAADEVAETRLKLEPLLRLLTAT